MINGWENYKVSNPKTLVLGSFNPYNPEAKPIDYYYGRQKNHFWKSVARVLGLPFDSLQGPNTISAKLNVMHDRFVCMDIIDQVEISSDNPNMTNAYINDHIFRDFTDQKIWATKSNGVNIKRTYNKRVIYLLNNTDNIKTIIHTMGMNKISKPNRTSPRESALGINGFEGYMNAIFEICQRRNIRFEFQSISPSDYAVKRGSTKIDELDHWIKTNALQ